MKTNTVSNTAFRGFGGPQGLIAAERMIEEIAYALGQGSAGGPQGSISTAGEETPARDALPPEGGPTTSSTAIVDELGRGGAYQARRESILDFNENSPVIKKGIALTPVKFGISFTATWYNQAGALVHVYRDGSIHLNHGGTEMGQGLNTKVAQVVAEEFQIDVDT
jgi:xanthine dehydrogenase large subunit